MQKNKTRKLEVKKETIRKLGERLTTAQLKQVAGGVPGAGSSHPLVC